MGMNVSQALAYIEKEVLSTPERDEILQFKQSSQRGIIRGGGTKKEEDNQD